MECFLPPLTAASGMILNWEVMKTVLYTFRTHRHTHSHLCWAAHCVMMCVPTQPEHVFTKLKMVSLSLWLGTSTHSVITVLMTFFETCIQVSLGSIALHFQLGSGSDLLERSSFSDCKVIGMVSLTSVWKPQNNVAFSNGTDYFIFLKSVNVKFLCYHAKPHSGVLFSFFHTYVQVAA